MVFNIYFSNINISLKQATSSLWFFHGDESHFQQAANVGRHAERMLIENQCVIDSIFYSTSKRARSKSAHLPTIHVTASYECLNNLCVSDLGITR